MDTSFGQHGVVLYFRFPIGIKNRDTKWLTDLRSLLFSLVLIFTELQTVAKSVITVKNIIIFTSQYNPSFFWIPRELEKTVCIYWTSTMFMIFKLMDTRRYKIKTLLTRRLQHARLVLHYNILMVTCKVLRALSFLD